MPTISDDQPQSYAYFHEFCVRIEKLVQELESSLDELHTLCREKATELDKSRLIYYIWSLLDSLSSSYSMWRYWAILFLTSDPDRMREMMSTPGAITGIICETLFLVSISVLGSLFEKEKDNGACIQAIVNIAPFLREWIKGLKNAFKGWQSAAIALTILGINLTYSIIPIGIGLGIIAAVDRSLMYTMKENRKAKMTANLDIIKGLKHLSVFKTLQEQEKTLEQYPQEKWDALLEQLTNNALLQMQDIKNQTGTVQALGYLGAALGGFIDGLYLYFGVLSLAVLAPSLLTVVFGLCAIYTLACVLIRVYENYDFELKLTITESKALLMGSKNALEIGYAKFCYTRNKLHGALTPKERQELEEASRALETKLDSLIADFKQSRIVVIQQSSSSYLTAGLSGLRNALAAYSALSSLLFLVSTGFIVTSSALPAFLLYTTVFLGLAFMAGFVTSAIYKKYQQSKLESTSTDPFHADKLKEMIEQKNTDQTVFKKTLNEGLKIAPQEHSYAPEYFEVLRSFLSWEGKGERFVESTGLERHYRPGIYVDQASGVFLLDCLSALLCGVVGALKAAGKGLGKEPLGTINLGDDEPAITKPKSTKLSKPPSVQLESPLPLLEKVVTPHATSEKQPPASPGPLKEGSKNKKKVDIPSPGFSYGVSKEQLQQALCKTSTQGKLPASQNTASFFYANPFKALAVRVGLAQNNALCAF